MRWRTSIGRIDDPKDHDPKASTDRGTAHDFVTEGSATREMIEVIPAQWGRGSPGSYFALWNLIHSGLGELALNYELSGAWKGSDALVAGVPETLARTEAMPYSFGYTFCTEVMRQWGLDGLDYIYNHPPVSSAAGDAPEEMLGVARLPGADQSARNLAGRLEASQPRQRGRSRHGRPVRLPV